MQTFIINADGYNVYIGNVYGQITQLLENGQYSKYFVLVDNNTSEFCLPKFREHLPNFDTFDIIEIDAGEANKNIDYCIGIWKMLLDFGADRNSLMINLGGGVVTDMGSFAASTFKRGMDFIQIPTTLLSQVDASVGGKTGIDVDNVKNIVGTFANPKAVFVDTDYLYTLSERERISGFAEMIKHGLICDSDYYFDLQTNAMESLDNFMIFRSVNIKNKIVQQDPQEKNVRKALNFGHTIGHAIESYSLENDKDPLLHGEAIAIGMICESYLSTLKAGLDEGALMDIKEFFLKYYPKYPLEANKFEQLITYMKNDKKNRGEEINFTLLDKIGTFSIDHSCTTDEIREALDYYQKLIRH